MTYWNLFFVKLFFYALLGAMLSYGGISVIEKPGTFFLILFSVMSIEFTSRLMGGLNE